MKTLIATVGAAMAAITLGAAEAEFRFLRKSRNSVGVLFLPGTVQQCGRKLGGQVFRGGPGIDEVQFLLKLLQKRRRKDRR